MKISKISIVASSLAVLMALSGCGSSNDNNNNPEKTVNNDQNTTQPANTLSLSIIHVNDSHSHLDGDTYSLNIDGNKVKAELGGYPRMVTKIKELQSANQNTLTLNAGDTFQGTLYYSLFKGKADSDMLNMISWDALELGNHEFDDGDSALATFLGDLNSTQVIAANVEPQTGNVLEGKWSPYIIKDYNGSKVGVIGIDTKQKTEVSSNPSSEIKFLDEVTTAQKYIDELKNKGINKIVLLTHQGYEKDKTFAAALSGVDVVIGGDSHTLLGDYSAAGLTTNEGYAYPTMVQNKDGEKVCIGQAWQYTYAVGDMKVDFDANGIVTSCSGDATLLLGDTFTINGSEANATAKSDILSIINSHSNLEIVAKDTATVAKLKTYTDQVDAQKKTVIGESAEFLGHNRIPGDKLDGKSNLTLGSDIAPIVAKSFYDLSNRADACIQNAGGVRIAVDEGNVTMDTAYTLLPFSNTLFEIEMYGSEIKQVLEDAMTNYLDNGGSTGSFPYAYGLRYDVNEKATANNRITNLEIKDRSTGTWSTISDSSMYVIVTNNYTAAGHDGYVTFKTVQDSRGLGTDTYLDYAMSFVKYMEKLTKEGKKLEKLPASDHCIKSFNAVLRKVGAYNTSLAAGSEIVAYDKGLKRAYATNGAKNQIDIINLNDITNPTLISSIDLKPYGTGVNSVAVKNGKVAVAVEVKTNDFLENFVTLRNWDAISVASNKDWTTASHPNDTDLGKPYAYINGYKADVACDDWLISKALTFDGNQTLSFETAKGYSGPDLKLKISTDYDGKGDPSTATWTELNPTLSSGSWAWTNSGDLNLSSYSGTGYIAFQYTSDTSAAAWEVANLRITNMKANTQDRGKILICDTNGNVDRSVTVGYLPDMVTFNEDGTKIVVANEGEPNGLYTSDPIGSVGIIDLDNNASYTDINFLITTLTDANDTTPVRLGGTPSNNQALDIEPEYITVKGDYAYVTLQENNALAKVNLSTKSIELVKSFGVKSYEADSNNTIDIEEDGVINMKSYPGLFGLYMPDSIASYIANGATYLVTANEGDGREYPTDDITGGPNTGDVLTDEKKIKKLDLDPAIADAYANENDLKVVIDMGDADNNGYYEKLYTYGARSFSIWDENGTLIWDSGDTFSKKVAEIQPLLFNQDEGEMDGRSGNKGCEPEALTVGAIDGKTYAFIGLERQNAIFVYDITDPKNPKFEEYYIAENNGDTSPEGMKFVPASESPNGKNLLLVAYEGSGSTVVYEINR